MKVETREDLIERMGCDYTPAEWCSCGCYDRHRSIADEVIALRQAVAGFRGNDVRILLDMAAATRSLFNGAESYAEPLRDLAGRIRALAPAD